MPLAILLLFLLSSDCWARLVNVTIDDKYGDARTGAKPLYSSGPGFRWIATTTQSNDVQNMTMRCRDGNYGNVTGNYGNVTLTFEGTLIYVFFVFLDYDEDTPLNVASYLDGESEPSGRYSRQSNVSLHEHMPHHLYNVLVFQSRPLPQRTHTLTVTVEAWLACFDYALYTVDEDTVQAESGRSSLTVANAQTETKATLAGLSATVHPLSSATESSGTSTDNAHRSHALRNRPALIGGPVAAAVVMLIGLLACFCAWRRRQRVAAARRASSDGTISRFSPPPATGNTAECMVPTSGKTTRPRASTQASTLTLVTPYTAQPDPAPAETEKERRRAAIIAKQNNPPELGTGGLRNARAREELEMLRKAVEPPPYSRGTGAERLG